MLYALHQSTAMKAMAAAHLECYSSKPSLMRGARKLVMPKANDVPEAVSEEFKQVVLDEEVERRGDEVVKVV